LSGAANPSLHPSPCRRTAQLLIGGINLKPTVKYILVAFVAVLVAATVLIVRRNYFQEKLTDYNVVNNGVVFSKEFSVKSTSENQNSSVKGTIFVWGDKEMPERMRIVASFEIDPKDFAGITIYIPNKWYITNILSSYPENQKPSLWPKASNFNNAEWRYRVEVGVGYPSAPKGGGTGTIVVDLVSDGKAILPSETVMVSIGSYTNPKNGVNSMGVGYIKIPISVDAES
jgi:hypothetical protein